jgi:hypothetical protein
MLANCSRLVMGLQGLMHAGCTDILGGGTCASLTSVKLPNASSLL